MYFCSLDDKELKMGINNFFKKIIKIITEIIENWFQIDAQNALKSSLGGILGLNFSSFGTGSRRIETGTWKMDVGIQKKSTGVWKMLSRVQGPQPGYRKTEYPAGLPAKPQEGAAPIY